MKLLIENKPGYDKSFILWLISILRMELMSSINLKKLAVLNKYFNDSLQEQLGPHYRNVNLNTVMMLSVRKLTFHKTENYFCIEVNPRAFVPGTKIRLYKICEFINYGNLDIEGCNVFTNVFANVALNLDRYYNLYCLERGL